MYGQYVEPIDYLNIAQCNFMHLLIKPGDIFELTQFQNYIKGRVSNGFAFLIQDYRSHEDMPTKTPKTKRCGISLKLRVKKILVLMTRKSVFCRFKTLMFLDLAKCV
jgi:hypothetical protein